MYHISHLSKFHNSPFILNFTILNLKAKETHGFNSCVVIRVYPLDIPSIKEAT